MGESVHLPFIHVNSYSLKQFSEAHIDIFLPQDMQEATVTSVLPAGVHYEGRLACASASAGSSFVCRQTEP